MAAPKNSFLLIAVLTMLCLAADASAGSPVLRVKDGTVVPFASLLDEMRKADIIFVGELHNRMEDHAHELEIIERLHYADVPMAIGLEMFRADSQKELDSWVGGLLPVDRFVPVFLENWRFPWSYYSGIFRFAREHGIPMVALNVSDHLTRKVARSGFSSLNSGERSQLPPGISCNVDPTYMDFIRRAYRAHLSDEKSFVHFCEAQMVWDKAMAWHLVSYLNRHSGKKLVVLSGVGHAWKRGIPEQVADRSKFSFVVILPADAGEEQTTHITSRDADYLFLD